MSIRNTHDELGMLHDELQNPLDDLQCDVPLPGSMRPCVTFTRIGDRVHVKVIVAMAIPA